jgi:predicted NBD/HSP70 family sugar kinase
MTKAQPGNRDLIRAINRSIILNTIKNNGPIDRARIARLTHLSPATLTGITADLIKEGLVFEKEPGDSRGGRRPILLALNPRGAYVVGIKLMEDHAVGALTDLETNVISKCSASLLGREPEDAVQAITKIVNTLLADAKVSHDKLVGVGIGLAGVVDFEHGVLRKSPFFGWRDLPLRDLLQSSIGTPIYLDNDVNTLTLAELWFGLGKQFDHFLTVTVGRGIGLGIVTNGRIYRGARGGAGEFGHTVINPSGAMCDCGKQGCMETVVGDAGLMRAAEKTNKEGALKPRPGSVDELLTQANKGQRAAQQVFAMAGETLGRSLSNLINLLNPQCILISGEGVRYGDVFFDSMRAALTTYTLPDLLSDCAIRIEPWGDDVWARGAASLVLRELFESPVHHEPALPVLVE